MHSLCVQLVNNGHELRVYADAGVKAQDLVFDRSCRFTVERIGGIKPWRRRAKARVIHQHMAGAETVLTDSWKSLELLDTSSVSRIVCLAHGMNFRSNPAPQKPCVSSTVCARPP